MGISVQGKRYAVLLGLAWLLMVAVPASAPAAELPPYELDPYLSLTGDCGESIFDPVPDPSCVGDPPAYPPPPDRPAGPFAGPGAIVIDAFGNEYVASYAEGDLDEGRVDIFDDEGLFVSEALIPDAQSMAIDGEGNLYVFEGSADIVRYAPSDYEPEGGKIAYEQPSVLVSSGPSAIGTVAVDQFNDHLFEARLGTLTIRRNAEEGNGVLESFEPKEIGPWTNGLAVDAQRRRIYVSFCRDESEKCAIKVLEADAPHALLDEIDGSTTPAGKFLTPGGRLGIAIDEERGVLFVSDPVGKTVYQFGEDYEYQASFDFKELKGGMIAVSNGKRSLSAEPCEYPDPEEVDIPDGDACNRHYLFVPALQYPGRVAAYSPPGQTQPVIKDVSTSDVGKTEAELGARIDPRGLETEYRFEITTQEAFEAKGFTDAAIVGEGTIASDSLAVEVSAFATGLSPGGTYRFRAVAENELGPALEEGQNEATFTTYDDVLPSDGCPNQTLRLGRSAQLPDCRAYELVTPPDTNGRAPRSVGFVGNIFTTIEVSPGGDALWYKIEGGSLPGSPGIGSFEGDPYVATRSGSGWSSELAGAGGDEATVSIPGSSSLDQGYSFWTARIEGPLTVDGINSEYLRYPDGHSEPIGRGSLGTDPRAQGLLITEDATHIIFGTVNVDPDKAVQLEPNAPPAGTRALYDRTIDPITSKEETHVVSLLPGDVTPGAGEEAAYRGASKDGEGVAFAIDNKLYLRLGNETTYEIGENVEFAGVSEGGERIFYVKGGNLEAFDTASEEVLEFTASGDVTPVNVATEGTRAYFVSPSVLGGASPEGDVAQAGEQNLYLSEEGAISFVATVTDRDVEGEDHEGSQVDGLGLWTEVGKQVARDPSRLTPDGSVLLFHSRADLTGYDSGEFPQIYRYDSTESRLHCISCIPTAIPATGGASLQTLTFDALEASPLTPNAFVPNLTPNGKRVFFESDEALVSDDTDEVQDVYEWEEAGVGSCDRAGGCVYLISSGQSSRDNFLYAHSESGDDVFFTTGDTLTGFDGSATTSIYDAKVGGGFSEPIEKECVADGCRPSVTPAPGFGKPVAGGEGDVLPQRKTCPKGKRRVKKAGKVRCVKQKKHRKGSKQGKTSAKRGAAR